METVGESFKRARKSQKIDLNTVSQDLKISESLLGDIENNQFPSYINVTFLIGHIRSYAKYLNLDEKLLIENFKIQISFYGKNLNNEMRKPNTPVIQFSFFMLVQNFAVLDFKTQNLKQNELLFKPAKSKAKAKSFSFAVWITNQDGSKIYQSLGAKLKPST